MTKLVAVVMFVVGAVFGLGLSILLNLIVWLAIGVVLVLAVDVAAGLSQRACGVREAVRGFLHRMTAPTVKSEHRKTIWIVK